MELKRCPFCGSDARIATDNSGDFDRNYVDCENNCHLFGCLNEDKWNHRPIEDALQAAHDNLAMQLQVANDDLKIAVEALVFLREWDMLTPSATADSEYMGRYIDEALNKLVSKKHG